MVFDCLKPKKVEADKVEQVRATRGGPQSTRVSKQKTKRLSQQFEDAYGGRLDERFNPAPRQEPQAPRRQSSSRPADFLTNSNSYQDIMEARAALAEKIHKWLAQQEPYARDMQIIQVDPASIKNLDDEVVADDRQASPPTEQDRLGATKASLTPAMST